MPEITWFRKDVKITENQRISYECLKAKKHRFLLTLTIKNPTLADGGMYRCNAFNPFGDSNANIDLNFECKLFSMFKVLSVQLKYVLPYISLLSKILYYISLSLVRYLNVMFQI